MRLRSTAQLCGRAALRLAACTEVAKLPVSAGTRADECVKPQRPELVATALVPDYDRHGALLVADDVGNVVWRVSTER